jgi:DNA-directed RNA polymerase subunit beta'
MDYLEGLKESIILGHRIPVGTGTKTYNNMIKEAVANGDTVAQIISKLAHPDVSEEAEDILDF